MNKIIKYNGKLNVIGTKIKKIRLEHGWSLTQLSDQLMFLGFDIPKSSIDNIEKGKRVVKEYEFYALCKVFDISMEEMLKDFIKNLK
ncbi:MAG: helix-turn-helix transcriptional regulator [Clostridia bacterium]|nr:helix-turn-helix transcriptional regulator [Clostridia bacterium]